jgi:acetyl esterase/lipase
MKWPALLTRERPQPSSTIRYGDDGMQVVDLWLPAGKGPHPTVLMVHGGCWQTEIADRRIMNWIADDLRKRGMAVWNIDYRGVDREGGGYPGTYLDAAAAADALGSHAKTHNLDISRLVAVGHSAGGHLALWLAARTAQQRGVVAVSIDRPGASAEAIEPETRKLERLLRGLSGVQSISSSISEGKSVSFARLAPGIGAEVTAAELRRRAAPGVTVETRKPNLPAGSPLLWGKALPIHTVVSLGGLPDLEEAARPPGSGCGTEVIAKISGGRFAETSVPRLAPLGVRQVLVNGLQDRIIPPAYAEGYATPMRAAGDKVEVRMVDRTGHVELIAPETGAWAVTVKEIEKALRR